VQNYEAHLQTEENRDWDQSQGLGFKWWLGGFWVVLWVARARQLSHYFIHKHILIFPAKGVRSAGVLQVCKQSATVVA